MNIQPTPFLTWLVDWEQQLPALELEEVVADPEQVAILAVDLVKGFCHEGPLASPAVAGIVPAVVDLFQRAYAGGVRHFLLSQDAHEPDALEFDAFAPHCVAGTPESETIDELQRLPFSYLFARFPKPSISSTIGTALDPWLEQHPEVTTFIVVGDCTDLCVYQAAMHLRLRANVRGLYRTRVLLPANCVQTYDLPVDVAQEIDAMPHDGPLLHRIFLYHMALNNVEVVARLG